MTLSFSLPGSFQEKQTEKFLQRGFPSRQEENWKYTDMSILEKSVFSVPVKTKAPDFSMPHECISLVFYNGYFCENLSDVLAFPESVMLQPLSQMKKEDIETYLLREYEVKKFPFAVLNSAQMREGFFLKISKNHAMSLPIHLVFLNAEQEATQTVLRNIILLEEGSNATIVEEHISESKNHFTNVVTEMVVGQKAHVDFYKIQCEEKTATHVATFFIRQQEQSVAKMFFLSNGAKFAREEVNVDLHERGAECYLHGLYRLEEDNQVTDYHLQIEHHAEQTKSDISYRGTINKKSRAIFNGKVLVHPGIKGVEAHQVNHNLLLSKEAEVNTKPELEIYSKDIRCTHGATVGYLDEEAVFYLQSRGMKKEEAVQLLMDAFSSEMVDDIHHPLIKKYLQQWVGHHE